MARAGLFEALPRLSAHSSGEFRAGRDRFLSAALLAEATSLIRLSSAGGHGLPGRFSRPRCSACSALPVCFRSKIIPPGTAESSQDKLLQSTGSHGGKASLEMPQWRGEGFSFHGKTKKLGGKPGAHPLWRQPSCPLPLSVH